MKSCLAAGKLCVLPAANVFLAFPPFGFSDDSKTVCASTEGILILLPADEKRRIDMSVGQSILSRLGERRLQRPRFALVREKPLRNLALSGFP